ncbi:MAG: thioredoxin domain-containing protein [Bacteroidota bacterium]
MNHLQHETSPYLLQHAHNPVEWYAWKPEAFERAKAENKPILVSIGYSTCHWCHVMERESFENETIAAHMNQYFINIKVDREERPDVDQIYMEACQLINGSGCGWPLNCFLTPDGRPFYAGTYFPPEPAYNRPSWSQVLERIAYHFNEKPEVVEEQANQLMNIINGSDNQLLSSKIELTSTETATFTTDDTEKIYATLQRRFDTQYGGFGGAPKFPSSMALRYLLNYHYHTKNEEALRHADFSLQKMIQGGIYDQLGGGFARYAVDRAWLVPHFEKMLYDNALLVSLMSDAYRLTQKAIYKESIVETLDFIQREMTSEAGGFYAALDADSEGVEGKFYVWQQDEIVSILGAAADLFIRFYGVEAAGNWEDSNIFWREHNYEAFATQEGLAVPDLKAQLQAARQQLFAHRAKRIRPGLDDKILLDWNGLMCTAYAQAYKALQIEAYREIAERNMQFLLEKFKQSNGLSLCHTYKNGQAQYDAFLNDYAFLIEALLEVYSISFDTAYLSIAQMYTEFVLKHFLDQTRQIFYFTADHQSDLVTRKIDVYDSAVPSGNATMVRNLQKLGRLLDRPNYHALASNMLRSVQASILKYPNSFGRWAQTLLDEVFPMPEIAIMGKAADKKAAHLQQLFLPNIILMASHHKNESYPLLKGKTTKEQSLIYVCQNYACQKPVEAVEEAVALIQQ